MTENNKLFNALDQLQLNTNNNDLKALEKEIFTEDNLKYIKADKGSDLYDFLNNDKCTIDDIIDNNKKLANDTLCKVLQFAYKTGFNNEGKVFSTNGFGINCVHNNHFVTIDRNGETIFDSVKDGRQFDQCCGIHAIEGVLIAEALKSLNDNDEKYNDFVSKYKNAFLDNENKMTPEEKANREKNREELKKILEPTKDIVLEEQRKIFLKTEVLDVLVSIVQTDEKNEKVKITPPNIKDDPDFAICETGESENEIQIINNITCINKLQKLYFEEFQARCAALQAVKKELGLKLDKVPEVQKIETPKQSASVTPQQITQKKEVTPETPKVETEAQKPVRRIIVENPEEEIEQKKEDKQQDKTAVKSKEGENDKKFNLPSEPKKESEIVNTQEVIEERQECDTPSKEEPNPSKDTQNSEISTTSSILSEQHPKMRPDTVYNWVEEESTDIETYDIEDNKIKKIEDINKKAAQLYLDILTQVFNETSKESGLEEMTEEKIEAIIKQTEKRVDACFTIRDENNNIVKILTDEEKESLKLARADYKNRAVEDEQVKKILKGLKSINNLESLREFNQRLVNTNEEMEKRFPQQAITAK